MMSWKKPTKRVNLECRVAGSPMQRVGMRFTGCWIDTTKESMQISHMTIIIAAAAAALLINPSQM